MTTPIQRKSRPPFLKRQLLIDRKCQLLLIAYTYVVVTIALLGNYLLQVFWGSHSATMMSGILPGWTNHFLFYFLMTMMIVISISSVLGLYISNQVAGPVYRLRQHMKAVREGAERAPVTFRDTDQFQELATEYNLLLKSLAPERLTKGIEPEND